MPKSVFCKLVFVVLATSTAHAENTWIGNFSFHSQRNTKTYCDSKAAVKSGQTTYGDWDRTRAVISNLCLEVYVPGLTDSAAVTPGEISVFVNAPTKYPARFIEKSGNNWVYAIDVKDLDPLLHGVSNSGNTSSLLNLKVYAQPTLGNFQPAESEAIQLRFD